MPCGLCAAAIYVEIIAFTLLVYNWMIFCCCWASRVTRPANRMIKILRQRRNSLLCPSSWMAQLMAAPCLMLFRNGQKIFTLNVFTGHSDRNYSSSNWWCHHMSRDALQVHSVEWGYSRSISWTSTNATHRNPPLQHPHIRAAYRSVRVFPFRW